MFVSMLCLSVPTCCFAEARDFLTVCVLSHLTPRRIQDHNNTFYTKGNLPPLLSI